MERNKEKNFISVVLYLYNKVQEISVFLPKLYAMLEDNFLNFEIICVNDDSKDQSREAVKKFAGQVRGKAVISLIDMSVYQGREAAMNAGVELAIGDYVFEVDYFEKLDGLLEQFMAVYNKAMEGYDIVSLVPENQRWSRRSSLFYMLYNRFSKGAQTHGCQKAGLEPSPVLIRALQIDVCRPVGRVVMVQGGIVGRAGIKPAVQGIRLLLKGLTAAVRTRQTVRNQLHGLPLKPNVGAEFTEELRNVIHRLARADRFSAMLAVKYGNRHPPAALPGNTPIRPLPKHRHHPVFAPSREPLHLITSGNRPVFKRLH